MVKLSRIKHFRLSLLHFIFNLKIKVVFWIGRLHTLSADSQSFLIWTVLIFLWLYCVFIVDLIYFILSDWGDRSVFYIYVKIRPFWTLIVLLKLYFLVVSPVFSCGYYRLWNFLPLIQFYRLGMVIILMLQCWPWLLIFDILQHGTDLLMNLINVVHFCYELSISSQPLLLHILTFLRNLMGALTGFMDMYLVAIVFKFVNSFFKLYRCHGSHILRPNIFWYLDFWRCKMNGLLQSIDNIAKFSTWI